MTYQTKPNNPSRQLNDPTFFGTSELAQLCRTKDWSATPLGNADTWPAGLRAAVRLCLASPLPMSVCAGAERILIYNDAYSRFLDARHPWALGQPADEVWAQFWDRMGAQLTAVLQRGESCHREDERFLLARNGRDRDEEPIITYAFTPIREDDGRITGALHVAHERTQQVQSTVASEARYRTLFESIEQGFCVIEVLFDEYGQGIDNRFLEVNPSFERHTGLVNAVGRRIYELVPDMEPRWPALYGQVATTGESVRFVDYSEAMGRWFEVEAFRVDEPALRRVGLLFNDITERKHAEQARRREADANAFRAALADALRSLDAPGQMQSAAARVLGQHLGASRVLYAAAGANGLFGEIGADDASGVARVTGRHRISDYGSLVEEELQAGRTVIVTQASDDPRLDTRERERTAALDIGAYVLVPLIKQARPVAVLSVQQDQPRLWTDSEVALVEETAERTWAAVERARTEQALREREAQFRLMADAVPQIVWITDDRGRVAFFNRQWAIYTGRTFHPETAAQVAASVVHPDDAVRTMESFEQAQRTGGVFSVEHRIRSAQGHYRWFLVRAEPYRDAVSGNISRWFGASIDIHDRKLAEQALQESDRRKDEFLAMLAHELRNPLAAIYNAVRLLGRATRETEPKRWVAILQRQADQLDGMVDDLLDVSRVTRGVVSLNEERVELVEIVHSALESVNGLIAEKGHRVQLTTPAVPMEVWGDAVRLEQISVNLLTNAAKYTDANGQIELELKIQNERAVLCVRDTGIGMAPDVLARVFELFGQAERDLARSEGGLGIGLTIVKRLVELHGGHVEARSAGRGHGSEFIVSLPLAANPQKAATAPAEPATPTEPAIPAEPAEPTPAKPTAKRILIVEDSPDVAETLAMLLGVSGHTVHTASDGAAAIEQADKLLPEVILLDIGLPGIDGYEVARRLRNNPRTGSTVLVALTGYGQASDRERSDTAGFDAHFVKPVKLDALQAFVAKVQPDASTHRAGH